MTTKELIKKLQEVDPSGELEVKMDVQEDVTCAEIVLVFNDFDRVILTNDETLIK